MAGETQIKLGVIGLGRAFMLSHAALKGHAAFRLVAAADPRKEARDAFKAEFGGFACVGPEALLALADVDAVYIASPHQWHAAQVLAALAAGKQVLVEKPMALSSAECGWMVDAARAARRVLMVGPSHGFDAPVAHAAQLIATGAVGSPRQIIAINATDFLWRPRRPEELDDAAGGGVVMSQAAHQLEAVRRLAGRDPLRIRAQTGQWDEARPCTGAYAAWLDFGGGLVAQLSYSGYGRYDSDALMGGVSEFGVNKDETMPRRREAILALSGAEEQQAKARRGYGGEPPPSVPPNANEHFGFILVHCERADLRLTPFGVEVHDDTGTRLEPIAPQPFAQWACFEGFARAVRGGEAALHDGWWGALTVRCCEALLESARSGREIDIVKGTPIA